MVVACKLRYCSGANDEVRAIAFRRRELALTNTYACARPTWARGPVGGGPVEVSREGVPWLGLPGWQYRSVTGPFALISSTLPPSSATLQYGHVRLCWNQISPHLTCMRWPHREHSMRRWSKIQSVQKHLKFWERTPGSMPMYRSTSSAEANLLTPRGGQRAAAGGPSDRSGPAP